MCGNCSHAMRVRQCNSRAMMPDNREQMKFLVKKKRVWYFQGCCCTQYTMVSEQYSTTVQLSRSSSKRILHDSPSPCSWVVACFMLQLHDAKHAQRKSDDEVEAYLDPTAYGSHDDCRKKSYTHMFHGTVQSNNPAYSPSCRLFNHQGTFASDRR